MNTSNPKTFSVFPLTVTFPFIEPVAVRFKSLAVTVSFAVTTTFVNTAFSTDEFDYAYIVYTPSVTSSNV